MRKISSYLPQQLALGLLFMTSILLQGQNCPEADLIFTNQSEIDIFQTLYPDCEVINQNISISGEDIISIDVFDKIKTIKGDLSIRNNDNLLSITTFNNLDSVLGGVLINLNDTLTELNCFSTLTYVGDNFSIDNENLEYISDLTKLKEVKGVFNLFARNTNLEWPRIESIKTKHLRSSGDFTSLRGRFEIESDGTIRFSNLGITNIDQLEIIADTLEQLSLSNCNDLKSLRGFENISHISHDLWVTNCLGLESLEGLNNIEEVGEQLILKNLPQLTSCFGLDKLKHVGQQVQLSALTIQDNENLQTLNGFDRLETIGSRLVIQNNPRLTNLEGLNRLKKINDYVHIIENQNLVNLVGLDSLQAVGDNDIIFLSFQTSRFIIRANENLISLQGLNQIDTIHNRILILDNPNLEDISAIAQIDTAFVNELEITGNSNLSVCNNKFVCCFSAYNNWTYVDINNNAPGCSSVDEVTSSCDQSLFDLDMDGFTADVDCDDDNPTVNPDAIEMPYNGLDDDCNSETLDDDLDQDGFVLADDCNDENSQINPSALEVPYNGLDDDCNSETYDDDLDQDGFVLADDCNDDDASINPDAIEIPNNGIDDNCDGITSTQTLSNTTISIYPNPSVEFINIDIIGKINYSATLYNLDGQVLQSVDNVTRLKVCTIVKGTYILEIEDLDTGQKIIEKIVIP